MNTIRITTDGRGIARLALARPEKRNAMSSEMIGELTEAAAGLAADPAVRVVVLAAEGPVFCAGGDLNWMRAQMEADDATRRREATALAMMLKRLNDLPKPLIGRVHGNAFGGGVGLISVTDTAIVAEGTRFGLTETRLGLIPATIGPYVIARMGAARARRVFFSSRVFGADEAVALGLASRVVAPEALDRAVEAEAAAYLDCAPGAVAEAKALIRTCGGEVTEAQIAASVDALVSRWQSAEADAGIRAFFEKTAPPWTPRD